MDWEGLSTDSIESQLVEDEELINRLRSRQLDALEELDHRQAATTDGARSLSEWVAARLDMAPESSRALVRTMRRTADSRDLRHRLSEGLSFDRVEALSRLSRRDPDDLLLWADVSRVRSEASKQARVSADVETRTFKDRFLVIQPTLDESWWRLWGGLDGHAGALVDKVLSERADSLDIPDGMQVDAGWRKATALAELVVADDPAPASVTVVVDARDASPTEGEAGVTLEPGVGVGRKALDLILCDAEVEVTARAEDGRLMSYGRKQRTAPPSLRRALLAESGFRCSVDGCQSWRRLQVHHTTPWSQGGRTDQEELVVLCWFHHQVAVHERGFQIQLHPDRRRVRLRNHEGRAPPI